MSPTVCGACGAPLADGVQRCPTCGAAPSEPPPATRDPIGRVHAPSTVTTPQQRKAIYLIVAIPVLLAAIGATVSWCARAPAHPTPKHHPQ